MTRLSCQCWTRAVFSILLCAGFQAQALPGDVFYVDQLRGGAVADGRSWESAYSTIQEGIEAARRAFGGEVWVAAGVYDENRANSGALRLRPGVELYGGFIGAEISRNQRDFKANLTIVDGSRSDNGAPAEAVVLGANEATIDGFQIRGARSVSGGGMLNVSVSPKVRNCTFTNNEAEDFGAGALMVDGAAPEFINCTFIGNVTLGSGGGMGVVDSSPLLDGCRFILNDAQEAGGGLFLTGNSTILIRNSRFEENTAITGGGAIFNDGGNLSLESSYFINNFGEGFGGMIFNNDDAETLLVNCVVAGNVSNTGGAAISSLGSRVTAINCTFADNVSPIEGSVLYNNASETDVVNSVIWYNSHPPFFNLDSATTIRWSNVGRGDSGPNNIALEPSFVDRENGDYRLRADSPSVDRGTADGAPPQDIQGVARPQGLGIDMGAYEMIGDGDGPRFECNGIVIGNISGGGGGPGTGELVALLVLLLTLVAAARLTPFRRPAAYRST